MQQVNCGTIRDDYLYFAMGSTMGILFVVNLRLSSKFNVFNESIYLTLSMYSIAIRNFNNSIQPIRYKTLYV
jgi:hypothetical protein